MLPPRGEASRVMSTRTTATVRRRAVARGPPLSNRAQSTPRRQACTSSAGAASSWRPLPSRICSRDPFPVRRPTSVGTAVSAG